MWVSEDTTHECSTFCGLSFKLGSLRDAADYSGHRAVCRSLMVLLKRFENEFQAGFADIPICRAPLLRVRRRRMARQQIFDGLNSGVLTTAVAKKLIDPWNCSQGEIEWGVDEVHGWLIPVWRRDSRISAFRVVRLWPLHFLPRPKVEFQEPEVDFDPAQPEPEISEHDAFPWVTYPEDRQPLAVSCHACCMSSGRKPGTSVMPIEHRYTIESFKFNSDALFNLTLWADTMFALRVQEIRGKGQIDDADVEADPVRVLHRLVEVARLPRRRGTWRFSGSGYSGRASCDSRFSTPLR